MNREEKLHIIADILEMEPNQLSEDLVLEEVESWDSVSILSVIAFMNSMFDKYPSAREIQAHKTVGELLDSMN